MTGQPLRGEQWTLFAPVPSSAQPCASTCGGTVTGGPSTPPTPAGVDAGRAPGRRKELTFTPQVRPPGPLAVDPEQCGEAPTLPSIRPLAPGPRVSVLTHGLSHLRSPPAPPHLLQQSPPQNAPHF